MNLPIPFRSRSRQRGSAFITVLIFSFVLLLLAGSIAQWSVSERKLNARSQYWLEARNAAEAVVEYGCSQVTQAFNTQYNPTFKTGGTNPLTFPTSIGATIFTGSNVDLSQDGNHNYTNIELHAGDVIKVPPNQLYYVNPAQSDNTNDPLKGRYVYRRDVTIVGKVTVNPPTGSGAPVTAYIQEKVSVRGAPLLAYAIFYSNNDLEFGETPRMDIFGPVHVNGNLFVGPAGPRGSTPLPLGFHGQVTASGNIYHAWRGTTSTAQEGGSSLSQTTAVNFSNDGVGLATGTMVNMRDSSGNWDDSSMGADVNTSGLANLQALITPAVNARFSQYASQTWKGNVQSAAMGIQSYNPIGFSDPVAADSSGNPIYATDPRADQSSVVGTPAGYGYGPHALIEPALAAPSSTDPYLAAKTGIEQGKFSRKAGMYVKVSSAGTIQIFGDPNSTPAGYSGTVGPNGGALLVDSSANPTQFPKNVIQYIPYSQVSSGSSYNVNQGMYDQRQDKQVNLVQIDLGKLKTAVSDMANTNSPVAGTDIINTTGGTKWGSGTAGTGYDQYTTGSTGWNGGIYVEIAQPSSSSQQTAVILADGKVASGSSLLPGSSSAPNGVSGLTVATNAPVYILGNLNADGSIAGTSASNNSALYPDDYPTQQPANSVETPVAIAADAVTVLSANYFGTNSSNGGYIAPNTTVGNVTVNSGNGLNSYRTSAPTATSDVEIAAALITGTVTTSPNSSGTQTYSGGVHNLPRFLENWSNNGNIVAIRGSMVSMYSSLIASAGWAQSYYSAPTRQWGYDQLFAAGKFPPIIPQVLSYRRADFSYLANATEYAAAVSGL